MIAPPERMPERDAAIIGMLPHIAFDGWTKRALRAGIAAAGMPADFRARLNSASAELSEIVNTRARDVSRCREATIAISQKLRAARWAVRVLDSLVRAESMNDPHLWRVWSTLRVVPAFRRRVGGQAPVSAAA